MKKVFIIFAMLLGFSAAAWEPNKTIKVIVGLQPGSGNELTFRAIAKVVESQNPKVNFIIENKPGADSVVGMNILMDADPDGHTIGIPSIMSAYVTNDIWQADIKKFQYNSFPTVLAYGRSPLALIAHKNSKANSLSDAIKQLQDPTNNINFALGGGAHRMAYEFIMINVKGDRNKVKPVMFNGPAPTVMSVSLDKMDTEFGIVPVAIAHTYAAAGKIKILAITGSKKLQSMPDVEVIKFNNQTMNITAGWTLALPPGTSKDVVDWYRAAFTKAIYTPEVQRYFHENHIYFNEDELSPAGFMKEAEALRKIWLPISRQIDVKQ